MENSRVTVAQFSALPRDWRSVHSVGGTKAKGCLRLTDIKIRVEMSHNLRGFQVTSDSCFGGAFWKTERMLSKYGFA